MQEHESFTLCLDRRQQGTFAESVALTWLEHHGYTLIESNYHRRIGELDLIVRHPDQQTVVFVEVRYRSAQRFGGALESVTPAKQRKLTRTANAWLQQNAHSITPARIDVIALCPATTGTAPEARWQGYELHWVINAVEE